MAIIKNLQTGETQEVEDKDLPTLVANDPNIAIPEGKYEFNNPLGEKVQIDAAKFRKAVLADFKYVDEDQKREEHLQKEYGDSPLKALAFGLARGFSGGLSDVAATTLGVATPEELRETKNRNVVTSGLGEALGIGVPLLASGGTSALANASRFTVPGAVNTLASAAGKKAALKAFGEGVASKGTSSLLKTAAAEGALKLGVEGAIEGAAVGLGKTLSEDAIGEAEFNAESLMANVGTGILTGSAFGAGLGGAAAVIGKVGRSGLKKLRSKAIDDLDIPAKDKEVFRQEMAMNDEIESALGALNNADTKLAISELGLKSEPTLGVLSPSLKTKQLESSLANNATLPGYVISDKLRKFSDEVSEQTAKLFSESKDTTPFQLGLEAKKELIGGVNERLRPAQETLKRIYDDLGEAPVRDRAKKLLSTRLKTSDAARLSLDKGLAREIEEIIPELNSINTVNLFKKNIGKKLSAAYRQGDYTQVDLLDDVYKTLSRVERVAIEDAAMLAGPKKGPKLAKEYLKAFDDSMDAYRKIYSEYTPLAEQLGTKLRSPDAFLDWIEGVEAEKLGSRLVDLNDYESAVKLSKDFPQLFDIARGRKLADFLQKVSNKDGISFDKFQTAVKKLTPEQKKIIFGFDASSQKRLQNLTKVMSQIPKQINPSGTSINQTLMEVLNPVFQGKEMLRYALYKGGDEALKKYLLRAVPVLEQTEKTVNSTRGQISSAVNGFYKAPRSFVTGATLQLNDDSRLKRAKEVYDQIQNNPEEFIDQYVLKNKDLFVAAPNTATALQSKLLAATQFLRTKVPRGSGDTFLGHEFTPSKSELLKFQDYVDAVESPMKVLKQMKEGHISPRSVEALKVIYPSIYSSIVSDLSSKMPKKLSKEQKNALTMILGARMQPIDYQSVRQFMQTQPEASLPGEPVKKNEPSRVYAGQVSKMNTDSRNMSGIERVINR